jgi:hypothetical protein
VLGQQSHELGKTRSTVADPHPCELLSNRIDQCEVVVIFDPVHPAEHWRR